MGFASRRSDNELVPISRAPSSGVRPRVLPLEIEAAPASTALSPVVPPRAQVARRSFDADLQLEDAVPLSSDAALAVVLGFVVVAASSLVAAFSVL